MKARQLIRETWLPGEVLPHRAGVRIYRTKRGRKSAIKQLFSHGVNYFICFQDVAGIALQYSWAEWMVRGYYVEL